MIENNNQIDFRELGFIIIPILLTLLLVGIALLIRHNNQLKKNNFKLNSLNNTFLVTLASKDLQLKEIHHRIKNNLQLIISLLNIEAGKNKEATIDDFLIKGQSRILSISLIHQNLYENGFSNTINLQNYIENIVKNLSQIYNTEIDIEINTNETILDVDAAIPLGLIITELVCNAFKHAFKDSKSGRIKIDIKKNSENKLELTLKDNGTGFPEKPTSKLAIGLELVQMMVMQLNGKLNRENQQGTIYSISFYSK
jgi:two-component sensor histidine kinase